jgi:feruloyl-CoA synthase
MMSSLYIDTKLGQATVTVTSEKDGSFVVSTTTPLEKYPDTLIEKLVEWSNKAPNHTFLAKRPAPGVEWVKISYSEALEKAHRIASALKKLNLSAERPIVILSENDIEHGLLSLGASLAGIPYAPISVPYSLQSQDFGKLRHAIELLTPGMVFATDGQRFGKAIETVFPKDCQVVLKSGKLSNRSHIDWNTLINENPTDSIESMMAKNSPDTIVKFLFTSGSTKLPKAVINTNKMICSNQAMIAQSMPFLKDQPPIFVDWLPWSHTFGGNHNFYMALFNGGTMYIDDGKPLPHAIGQTIENLREISPTIYFNVPKGFDGLAQAFKTDEKLRNNFFKELKLMFYAGASLPAPVWELLFETSEKSIGKRVPMITSLGMTESSPAAIIVNRIGVKPGEIGVPMPGVSIKLVPSADKMEARYSGPSITPGYWRMPEESDSAFDESGWFCTGDALKLVDEKNPDLGLAFNGRTGEDFKLDSGTWVCTTSLRNLIAQNAAPYLLDTVIAGHDRKDVTALLVPNLEMCRKLATQSKPDASAEEVLRDPGFISWFQNLADSLSKNSTGGANRIARWLVIESPLSLDRGELTDKGSINQRMVLKNHPKLVEALYQETQIEQPIIISSK